MIKRLLCSLILLCGFAVAQGGQFGAPSVAWTGIPATTLQGSSGVSASPSPYAKGTTYPVPGSGIVVITTSNFTGSPSTCVVQISFGSTVAFASTISNGTTFTPLTGTNNNIFRVGLGVAGTAPYGFYSVVWPNWTCTTYPTGGTLNIEFIPDVPPLPNLYGHVTTNTSSVFKTSPSLLHSVVINTPGSTETITIYDNTTCTGTIVGVVTSPATVGQTILYDVQTNTGLCVLTAGTTAGDYTVTYR